MKFDFFCCHVESPDCSMRVTARRRP
jgi:hypothetical protein